MPTIFVVPIEPLQQRYSAQWYYDVPKILERKITARRLNDWHVKTIDGEEVEDKTTSGAFLDFGATNAYKASQVVKISQLFSNGEVQPGDKFLVTDFWNFAVTAIRYMSELLEIPVELHCIAHAGAYDPTDILGMKMNKKWANEQERAWYYASDYMYFGTEFHRKMFLNNLNVPNSYHRKAIRSGQPSITFAKNCFDQYYENTKREDLIVFPHRLNNDKQPEIFRSLMNNLDLKEVVTQDNNFTKDEYYAVLGKSKLVFSCSLHENLGISQMEGVLCGAIPVVPDRASYREIYNPIFKYPSKWTESHEAYENNKDNLVRFINNLLINYEDIYENELREQANTILEEYMSPKIMVDLLLK